MVSYTHFQNQLKLVIEEREQQEAGYVSIDIQSAELIKAYSEHLREEVIDANALIHLLQTQNENKKRPLYKYIDQRGRETYWTVHGRRPKQLVGQKLQDYLMTNN